MLPQNVSDSIMVASQAKRERAVKKTKTSTVRATEECGDVEVVEEQENAGQEICSESDALEDQEFMDLIIQYGVNGDKPDDVEGSVESGVKFYSLRDLFRG